MARSVYNAGAKDGLTIGLYLSATFLLQAMAMSKPVLGISDFSILILLLPVLAYVLLKRGYRHSMYAWTFSAIWLHGIVMFLCGSLIMGLVGYVYMRYVHPTFIYDMFVQMIDTYRSAGIPEATSMADTLQKVIDKRLLPSPMNMVFSLIWLTSFTGAILSMLIAALLKLIVKTKVERS